MILDNNEKKAAIANLYACISSAEDAIDSLNERYNEDAYAAVLSCIANLERAKVCLADCCNMHTDI